MKKKLCYCFVVFMLIASFACIDISLAHSQSFECFVPQTSYYALPPEENIADPCRDDIRWCFKIIDGMLYRRKYNYTKCVWVGNWEKAY